MGKRLTEVQQTSIYLVFPVEIGLEKRGSRGLIVLWNLMVQEALYLCLHQARLGMDFGNAGTPVGKLIASSRNVLSCHPD